MKHSIGTITARGKTYSHTFDDGTKECFVKDVAGERVFAINEGGWTHSKAGNITGRFVRNENMCWCYETLRHGVRVNTKLNNVVEAQKYVIEKLINLKYVD